MQWAGFLACLGLGATVLQCRRPPPPAPQSEGGAGADHLLENQRLRAAAAAAQLRADAAEAQVAAEHLRVEVAEAALSAEQLRAEAAEAALAPAQLRAEVAEEHTKLVFDRLAAANANLADLRAAAVHLAGRYAPELSAALQTALPLNPHALVWLAERQALTAGGGMRCAVQARHRR